MKHLLIIFFVIFTVSRIQEAVAKNTYLDKIVTQEVEMIANTYSDLLNEITANSTESSNYHKEKIFKQAQRIISGTKKTIDRLKNKWELEKLEILKDFVDIDMSECSNIFNIYDEYSSGVLNNTVACTNKYTQNITDNIHHLNETVKIITTYGKTMIETRKIQAKECLDKHAHSNESTVFNCTQYQLGELSRVAKDPNYKELEIQFTNIAQEIETLMYSCAQINVQSLEIPLQLHINNFATCVYGKERKVRNASKIKSTGTPIKVTEVTTTIATPIKITEVPATTVTVTSIEVVESTTSRAEAPIQAIESTTLPSVPDVVPVEVTESMNPATEAPIQAIESTSLPSVPDVVPVEVTEPMIPGTEAAIKVSDSETVTVQTPVEFTTESIVSSTNLSGDSTTEVVDLGPIETESVINSEAAPNSDISMK